MNYCHEQQVNNTHSQINKRSKKNQNYVRLKNITTITNNTVTKSPPCKHHDLAKQLEEKFS